MEREALSSEDRKADARRQFRWGTFLVGSAWIVALLVASERLTRPDVVGSERIFWIALPLLLLPPAYLGWAAAERRRDEMQTAIEGRAAVVAFRLTIFWLFGLVLLDAAFGLPLEIPAPFGLPADTLGWKEAAIAPLFFHMFAWIREYRRILPEA